MSRVLVGDPVDVVSGAQFDVALDFRIAWPFPFEWKRFYDTARVAEPLALGWGHTHSYDHRLRFDVNGLLYVDPSGAEHGFAYPVEDGASERTPRGTLTRIDARLYRVKVRDHLGCEFQFDAEERPARLLCALLGEARHELLYDSDGTWTGVRYRNEPRIRIQRTRSGRIESLIWEGADHGRDRLLWLGRYDEQDNLIAVTDVYGTTQTFGYDAARRMTQRTDRNGFRFEASYDRAGRCDRSAAEDGVQEVRMRYLPVEGVTVVTRADGGDWQYFHQGGAVTRIVDPGGGVTEREYGPDGKLAREIGPMEEVLREAPDAESGLRPRFGPPSGMALPLGDPWFARLRDVGVPRDALAWEGYGTDRCRNLVRLPRRESAWVHALPGHVVDCIRFAQRPEEAATPPRAHPSREGPAPKKKMGVPGRAGMLQHDAFGRLIGHSLPTGETCRWQYDANGNVVRHVDYAGSEWRYDHASWNLRVREIDPLGNVTQHTYNRLELPTAIADAGGTSTEHEFDLQDRMTVRRRHAQVRDVLGYDRSGGLVSLRSGSGAVRVALVLGEHRRPVEIAPAERPRRRYGYDARGRLVSVAGEDEQSLAFAYENGGERSRDFQNGRGVERRHDGARVSACIVLEKFVTEYVHDRAGGRVTIIDPLGGRHVVQQLDLGVFVRKHASGVEELAQFDWSGRCLAKVRFRRNDVHDTWARVYQYSPVGALTRASESGRATAYEYDAAHRLVSALRPDGTRESFVHDAAGNLVESPTLRGAALDANRLVAANGRRLHHGERHHVERESGAGERSYEYDPEDRLLACSVDGVRVEFRYDALGRRLEKNVAGARAQFVWDGERIAAEISGEGRLRVYVYADEGALTPFVFVDYDSIDADPASGRRRYVFGDQIACPVLVEDDAGRVLWRARIEPYGRASIDPGSTLDLDLRWPGHHFDAETGLHYNRHRYYSPELGRYLQVDPRDLEGGLNVYAYTSRPLDSVDVDGLAPCPKKPMVTPDEDDPAYQAARQRADEVSDELRQALHDARDVAVARGKDPREIVNTTLTSMVVLRADGTYEVVVTGNRPKGRLPADVQSAVGGTRYIAHGDDAPPPIRQGDTDWRYPRTRRDGTEDASTHRHAEQRGLRATDCDPETQGVAYVAPTRPCCDGCSAAITTPHEDGGWGGDSGNISDRGNGI
jgi:RHS repeat-associated protein